MHKELTRSFCEYAQGYKDAGGNKSELYYYALGHLIGEHLMRVIIHYSAGLASFGPRKFHSGAKGKGGIRSTRGAGDYLSHLKRSAKSVTDLCDWLAGRQLTNNSYIGFCPEAILEAKLKDRGRCLLSFKFEPEHEQVRSGIFERSVGDLVVSNEAGDESALEKLLDTSVKVETLQQKKPSNFHFSKIDDAIMNYLEAVPLITATNNLVKRVAGEIRGTDHQEFDLSLKMIDWYKKPFLDQLEAIMFLAYLVGGSCWL